MSILDYGVALCDNVVSKFPTGAISPNIHMFTYHHGVLLSGMQKIGKYKNEEKYREFIKLWVADVTNEDGTIPDIGNDWCSLKSLDFRQPGILLFDLYEHTKEEKYAKILKYLTESLEEYPVTQEGIFWHAEYCPNEVWLDGLYMVSPLLSLYAKAFSKPKYFDMAAKQILFMYEKMKDENGLLRHGYDGTKQAPWADQETGLSQEVWGRAMGWYVMATAEVLEVLPKDHADRARIEEIEKELLTTLVGFQHESGRWYQVIDKVNDADNWLENSCSCLITAAVAKAVKMGILGEEFVSVVKKGVDGVLATLGEENGLVIVPEICIGTCIDEGTKEHYYAREKIQNDMHGTGAFLIMIGEAYGVLKDLEA